MFWGQVCVYTFPDNFIYNDNSKWGFNKIELSGQTGITPAQPARSPCCIRSDRFFLCGKLILFTKDRFRFPLRLVSVVLCLSL